MLLLKRLSLLRRTPSRSLVFGAAACFVGVIVIGSAGPASAHAAVESTSPQNGAVLAHGPKDLTVTFSEAVVIARAPALTDASGAKVSTAPALIDSAGRRLVVHMPSLAHGTYVLSWRVESSDGHPVQGALPFSVGMETHGGVDAAALARKGLGGDASIGALYAVLRGVTFAAVVVAVGGIFFFVVLRPGRRRGRRDVAVLLSSMITAVASGALTLLVVGPYLEGGTMGDFFTGKGLSRVFEASLGRAIGIRILLGAIGVGVVWRSFRVDASRSNGIDGPTEVAARRSGPVIATLGWSVAVMSTLSYSGHPRTGRWQSFAFVNDIVHVGAASIWIGGLVFLGLALRSPIADIEETEQLSVRFSRCATVCVAIVAATGVAQGFRQLSAVDDLWNSTYGRFLLLKALGVGVILLIAATSRRVVHKDLDGEIVQLTTLRNKVIFESCIAAVVIALTAGLVNAGPPRDVARSSTTLVSKPIMVMSMTPSLHFEVTLTPGRAGRNTLTIDAMSIHNATVRLVDLTVKLSSADGSVTGMAIPVTLRDGVYQADNVIIPTSGTWRMHLAAVTGPVDQVDTEIALVIP